MKNKTLKELNDTRLSHTASPEIKQAAQEEWEKRHQVMVEKQESEKFENSFWSGE